MISTFTGPHAFLSNFYPARVTLDGVVYPTVEHAYQAAKSADPSFAYRLSIAALPGTHAGAAAAKRAGRHVPLRPDWERVKVGVMRDLLRQKFAHLELRAKLAATDEELVEGNWWGDRFWGQSPLGVGENWLGRILMEIRGEIAP